ncbi:F-box protein SKIP19 [Linum grandiflorum]
MDPPKAPCSSDVVAPDGSALRKGRDWALLSPELLAEIMSRLGLVDRLKTFQKVCSSWRKVCRDPHLWRCIDMKDDCWGSLYQVRYRERYCAEAVDVSCGGLVSLSIEDFGTDRILDYIANKSSQLKSLRLVRCHGFSCEGIELSRAVKKFSFLEELEISYCPMSNDALLAVGHYWPFLRTLKLNHTGYKGPGRENDMEATAIADNMPGLHHLQLFGNRLTNRGLQAILDSCRHLESLDLRQCFYLKLEGDLEKRCRQQIKDLRCPEDSVDDYPYSTSYAVPYEEDYASESSENELEEDYPSEESCGDELSSDDDEMSDNEVFNSEPSDIDLVDAESD